MGTETVNRGKVVLLSVCISLGHINCIYGILGFCVLRGGGGVKSVHRIYPSPLKANYGRLQIGWIALKITLLIQAVTLATSSDISNV